MNREPTTTTAASRWARCPSKRRSAKVCAGCGGSYMGQPNQRYCTALCSIRARARPAQERFFESVQFDTNGGCWLWSGSLRNGYGQINVEGRLLYAHRYSYERSFGDPGNLFVCHRCDVRACVNPAHLFLGTSLDNVRDMLAKGRNKPLRGASCPAAKITEADVLEIRRLEGLLLKREIGERFGISHTQVGQIQRGKYWSHLPYAETRAGTWWEARQRGERLSAHELRCELCGELSEPPVCGVCTETQLEALNYERTREAH